jgi:hypothetical protein
VWKFEVSGTGMAKCFLRQTNDDDVNAVATSPNWDINFSTSKTEIQVEFETYEKDADGDYCVWSPTQDDVGQRAAETRTFGLTSLEEGQSFDWEFRGKLPDDDCIMVAFGKITRFASDAQVPLSLSLSPPLTRSTTPTEQSISLHDAVSVWRELTWLMVVILSPAWVATHHLDFARDQRWKAPADHRG